MQEDKNIKRFVDQVRIHQEESTIPYEEGAWEKFDKIRKKEKTGVRFWNYGIAASLILGISMGTWLIIDPRTSEVGQKAISEKNTEFGDYYNSEKQELVKEIPYETFNTESNESETDGIKSDYLSKSESSVELSKDKSNINLAIDFQKETFFGIVH